MLKVIASFLVNLSLVVCGLGCAYLLERAIYGLSGEQWQVSVSAAGVSWLVMIIGLLWAVAIFSGFYLGRDRGPMPEGQQLPMKWYAKVWREIRFMAEHPLFWARSSLVLAAVALFAFGVRGLLVQGRVRAEPSHVIFLNPPESPTPILASITVFFENGSAHVDAPYKKLLDRFAEMDVACGISQIEITGNTSSAPFVAPSKIRNPDLANQRVAAVEQEIKSIAGKKVTFAENPWAEENAMFAKHWILDNRESNRLLEAEPFNRRVDLLIKTKNQCDPAPGK